MDWPSQLISLYLTLDRLWKEELSGYGERHSNNKRYALDDVEVLTIYLFGIINGHYLLSEIHRFTKNYLADWFPELKTYPAFAHRVSMLEGCFEILPEVLFRYYSTVKQDPAHHLEGEFILDSLPIILARRERVFSAKTCEGVASRGYCATKGMYYYGVKLHLIVERRFHRVPIPQSVYVSKASEHDLTAFQNNFEFEKGTKAKIFADKAYWANKKELSEIELVTPLKKRKGQFSFPGYECFSRWVAQMRQPIESFFNWVQEKTHIQNASKVRSHRGLIVHIHGKIAAAVLMLFMNL